MQGNSLQDTESILRTTNREKNKPQIICFTLKGTRSRAAKTKCPSHDSLTSGVLASIMRLITCQHTSAIILRPETI